MGTKTDRNKIIEHEQSYKRWTVGSLIHRNRLNSILNVFNKYIFGNPFARNIRTWADFGCSNGFIADAIQKSSGNYFNKIVGYDAREALLERARQKNVRNAEFRVLDLNQPSRQADHQFSLVTCFETLEHTGNELNAVEHLYNHLAPHGLMIISVPNETGIPGVIKLFGRLFFQKNPYQGFFIKQSFFKYVIAATSGGSIGIFRDYDTSGFGPHLGYDFRNLQSFIKCRFISNRSLCLLEQRFTVSAMNVIFVFRKQSQETEKKF